MLNNMKEFGLVAGRHEMPVDYYIFNEIKDPFDFKAMRVQIEEKLSGIDGLRLYVSGLTTALAEVIKYCHENDIALVLMHYDRDTDAYRPQVVLMGYY